MTDTFQNLPEEKQERILRAAGDEFARHGYENAKMNEIARAANVSVGSLYKYFENKQDMYLEVIHSSVAEMEHLLTILSRTDDDILVKARRILQEIQRSSREDPLLMKLYSGAMAQNNPEMAAHFAREIETATARIYCMAIREAQEAGEIRSDIDPGISAFLLHSLFMMLQFSYACEYQKERMKLYAGEDTTDEYVVKQILKFINYGLNRTIRK